MMNATHFSYLVSRFSVLVIDIANGAALFLLILGLNRLFATNESDISTVLSILATLVGMSSFWQYGDMLITQKAQTKTQAKANANAASSNIKRKTAIVINLTLISAVLILWLWLLDYDSDNNFRSAGQAVEENRLGDALTLYQKSLFQQPDRFGVHFELASLYERISQFDKAKQHYWLAIYAQNTHFRAYNNLARIFIKEGESRRSAYYDSLELLDKALEDNSNTKQNYQQSRQERAGIIYKNIAWNYLKLNDHLRAERNIALSLKQFSLAGRLQQHPEAYCLYAIIVHGSDSTTKKSLGSQFVKSCHYTRSNTQFGGMERALEQQAKALYPHQ